MSNDYTRDPRTRDPHTSPNGKCENNEYNVYNMHNESINSSECNVYDEYDEYNQYEQYHHRYAEFPWWDKFSFFSNCNIIEFTINKMTSEWLFYYRR